tara:strand:- start:3495 stop:3674 length:180 start_codon:yes stop_codon:yes gene_type:complete
VTIATFGLQNEWAYDNTVRIFRKILGIVTRVYFAGFSSIKANSTKRGLVSTRGLHNINE